MKMLIVAVSFGLAGVSVFGKTNSNEGADAGVAAKAVNALGLDLLSKAANPQESTFLSPYSIQAALAMTYAGADGQTRSEMERVLHYSGARDAIHGSFAALKKALEQVARESAARAKAMESHGGSSDPFTLSVANRLYGQQGYAFREAFLSLTSKTYEAPFEPVDFIRNSSGVRDHINSWVSETTRERIRDLIPPDGLDRETRLVLVNAIYMKAPWADPFAAHATRPEVFYADGERPVNVPTMSKTARFGYSDEEGYSILSVPYAGGAIQFVVLLPDERNGLAALEGRLQPDVLQKAAHLPSTRIKLHLPEFKMQPPLFRLSSALRELGMKSAFNVPEGSANFDRMAPRKPNDYLYISEVFHKTFVDLDEKGTEAAAATAVSMARATSAIVETDPIEVRVDRPFIFAIQHRPSGACLFLGRMLDPR